MRPDDTFDPPLQLQLTAVHPSAKFETPAHLLAWFSDERSWLDGLRNKPDGERDGVALAAFGQLHKSFVVRQNAVAQLVEANADQGALEAALSNYVADLEAHRLLHSRSRMGLIIDSLAATDAWQGLRTIIAYCNVRFSLSQTDQPMVWARAAATVLLVEKGHRGGVCRGPCLFYCPPSRWLASWTSGARNCTLTTQRVSANYNTRLPVSARD